MKTLKSKKQISFLTLCFLLPFLFISCEDDNITSPSNNGKQLLFNSLLSDTINADNIMALFKLSSMYTGYYSVFSEGSFAWAYLTDGVDLVPANIKCNGELMRDMSPDTSGGQYEFFSRKHVNNYEFVIPNYLGQKLIVINETDVPTLKVLQYTNGDTVSLTNGFTLNYSGYNPDIPINLCIYLEGQQPVNKELVANGSIEFTPDMLKKLVGNKSKVWLQLSLIQDSSKIVDIGNNKQAFIIIETMTGLGFVVK